MHNNKQDNKTTNLFYSNKDELAANDVKFKTKDKFEDKLLVFAIMSTHGT